MRSSRVTAAAALSLALLATSACGDSDEPPAEPRGAASSSTSSPSGELSDDPAARACTADDIEVGGGFGTKPTVTIPDDCTPPTELLTKDLVDGSGPEAAVGGTVLSNYLLVTWSDRNVLDNSFDRGEPFPVTPLGSASVIQGWNEGLIGMKKGTRRLLVVPPDLGYGQGGNGVAPNETLVFVIDAVDVS